jgi:hypothetical protein
MMITYFNARLGLLSLLYEHNEGLVVTRKKYAAEK